MRQIVTVDDLKRAELALDDSYRGRCGSARTRRIRRGWSGLLPRGVCPYDRGHRRSGYRHAL
jgi:hypothetical protein